MIPTDSPKFNFWKQTLCLGLLLLLGMNLSASNHDSVAPDGGMRQILSGNFSELDSLNRLLNAKTDEIERVDLLNSFARDFLDTIHGISLTTATEALRMANLLAYDKGAFQAHMTLAQVQVNYTLNYDRGLPHLTTSYGLAVEMEDLPGQFMALRLIGFVHNRLDNHTKSLEYYNKAAEVAEALGDKNKVSDLKAYIAYMLEEQGDREGALRYFREVLDLEEKDEFKTTTDEVHTSLGRYFYLTKEYDEALYHYGVALKGLTDRGSKRWISYLHSVRAEVYLGKGDLVLARQEGESGLKMAREFSLIKEKGDNLLVLSEIHMALEEFEKAYRYNKAYYNLRDSVYSIDKEREIAKVQASYEQMMQDQELASVKQEKEMQQTRTRIIGYSMAAGLVLIGLLALFLYRAYNQKKEVNKQLEDRVELKDLALADIVQQLRKEIEKHEQTQAKLESTHSELNHFIYKSSHDLKGPLASIMGLCNIAENSVSPEERQRYIELIRVSSTRLSEKLDTLIQATRLIEGRLQLQRVDFKDLLDNILHDLRNREFAVGVALRLDLEKGLGFQTDGHLIQTMLVHLLENGMRYKDHSQKHPFVMVTGSRVANEIRISVMDNGRGIPDHLQSAVFDMFVKSNMEFHSSGLGLYLVKKTVDKLGGRILLQSEEGVGTTFTIHIPAINEAVAQQA